MRGSLETIVGAMFAGKTSELLKRILWAKHQNKKWPFFKDLISQMRREYKNNYSVQNYKYCQIAN